MAVLGNVRANKTYVHVGTYNFREKNGLTMFCLTTILKVTASNLYGNAPLYHTESC